MGAFRWRAEDIEVFNKRAEGWRKNGTVTTHLIEPKHQESKFRNVRVNEDGRKFASKKEAQRWKELRLLEAAKAIKNLKHQVRYPLEVNGQLICDYIADFTYENETQLFVEDTKGFPTPEYKLKKKMMKAIHGIEILET